MRRPAYNYPLATRFGPGLAVAGSRFLAPGSRRVRHLEPTMMSFSSANVEIRYLAWEES